MTSQIPHILLAPNEATLCDNKGNNISAFTYRNRIINGNFDFWQRGTSGTGYVADRWFAQGNVERVAFSIGQPDVPFNPTFYLKTTGSYIEQRIENVALSNLDNYIEPIPRVKSKRHTNIAHLSNSAFTLSFWSKSSSIIEIDMLQEFGNELVVTRVGNDTHQSISSNDWTLNVFTLKFPAITGKAIGENSYYGIRINCSGEWSIAQVQLEPGIINTPFEQRPIGLEAALCQRYFEIVKVKLKLIEICHPNNLFVSFKEIKAKIPIVTLTDLTSDLPATYEQTITLADSTEANTLVEISSIRTPNQQGHLIHQYEIQPASTGQIASFTVYQYKLQETTPPTFPVNVSPYEYLIPIQKANQTFAIIETPMSLVLSESNLDHPDTVTISFSLLVDAEL